MNYSFFISTRKGDEYRIILSDADMEVTDLSLRSSKKWSRCFFHFSCKFRTFEKKVNFQQFKTPSEEGV